jgi:hypothetical protein
MNNFMKLVRLATVFVLIGISAGCAVVPNGGFSVPIRQNGVQYGAIGGTFVPAGGYGGQQGYVGGSPQAVPSCQQGAQLVRLPNGQLACQHYVPQVQPGYGGYQRPLQCPMVYVRGGGWRCQ